MRLTRARFQATRVLAGPRLAFSHDHLNYAGAVRAWHVSEGKRLYDGFNCTGCHAYGGGDIGPPLMDDQWI